MLTVVRRQLPRGGWRRSPVLTVVRGQRLCGVQQRLEQRLGHPGLHVEEGVAEAGADPPDDGGGRLADRPVVLLRAGA